MKFFIDTANIDEIREAASLGVLDGVTTNPSLVAKEGKDFHQVLREIVSLVNGPISAEVTSTNKEEMLVQGRELAAIHPNIVVKAPLTREGLQVCKALRSEGIKVNVTLCFSASQALLGTSTLAVGAPTLLGAGVIGAGSGSAVCTIAVSVSIAGNTGRSHHGGTTSSSSAMTQIAWTHAGRQPLRSSIQAKANNAAAIAMLQSKT